MRPARFLLIAALALAGCSSGGDTFYERVAPVLKRQVLGPPAPTTERRKVTRAELNRVPYAMISIRHGDNPPGYVVPIVNNDGYLVYQDAARRGVIMQGGLITATLGFGYNLDAVAHLRDDPVVAQTPLPEWPGTVTRSYSFTPRGRAPYRISVRCTFDRGVREFIEIVERRYEVVRVTESCVNPERRFANTYWVEPGTGFIWKSVQWVGPRIPAMTIEIIRPFAEE